MKNTFCIKFYCRKGNARKNGEAPVEVSVIIRGERQMWQLPKKCKPEEFSKNRDIQNYCTAVENKLNQIYTNLSINDESISAFKVKDIYLNGNSAKSYTLRDMFDDGLKLKANGNIDTYNKYKRVTDNFLNFTGYSDNREANSVTYADILTFKNRIEDIHQPQTSFKELQHLKYFFALAFQSGKIKQNPFGALKIKNIIIDKPYLTYEEVSAIRKLKIGNDRLDKVRDLFLFLCFTGIEWADLLALQKDEVKKNSYGDYYIKKDRVKTGVEYVTILYEDAVDVWDCYDGDLPIISPQKFNKYIKEIATLAGIEKDVTSLTARHTFATYLLSEKGLSLEVVAKMLGHTSTKETIRYSKMLETAVFEANAGIVAPKRATTQKQLSRAEYEENMDDIAMFEKILGI